jgi:hypothetical protein
MAFYEVQCRIPRTVAGRNRRCAALGSELIAITPSLNASRRDFPIIATDSRCQAHNHAAISPPRPPRRGTRAQGRVHERHPGSSGINDYRNGSERSRVYGFPNLLQCLVDTARENGTGHYSARVHFACIGGRASEHFDNVAARYHPNSDSLSVAHNERGACLGWLKSRRLLQPSAPDSTPRVVCAHPLKCAGPGSWAAYSEGGEFIRKSTHL